MKITLRSTLMAAALSTSLLTFALPQDIKVIPLPDTTLEQLDEFYITSGWLELKYSATGEHKANILINGQGAEVELTSVSYEEIKVSLTTPYAATGTCNIILPENTFLMGWDGDPNPVIEFSYTIENNKQPEEPGTGDVIMNQVPEGYTFAPAAGTELEVLSQFSVTSDANPFLTPASRKTKITINGASVYTITTVSGELDNTLTWQLADPITEPGLYTIYIPEGEFWGYDEEDNKPFLVTLKVTGGEAPAPNCYPGVMSIDPPSESKVTEIKKIAVTSEKLSSLYIGPDADSISVRYGDEATDVPFTLTPDEDDFNEAHVIWMEFERALTAEGTYTFEFPVKSFVVAKYPNNWFTPAFSATLTVDPAASVTEIENCTSTRTEYYNMQGVRISEPVKGLPVIVKRGDKVTKEIF